MHAVQVSAGSVLQLAALTSALPVVSQAHALELPSAPFLVVLEALPVVLNAQLLEPSGMQLVLANAPVSRFVASPRALVAPEGTVHVVLVAAARR
jgi:hypothetical protein